MRLIDIRQNLDTQFASLREQASLRQQNNPSAHTDAEAIYYHLYLQANPLADENVELRWEHLVRELHELTTGVNNRNDLFARIIKQFGFFFDEGLAESINDRINQAYQYSDTLIWPQQTLRQRYEYIIQAHQDSTGAAIANYEDQDILHPATHLGFGEKDLIYCILARDKYQIAADRILPRQTHFTRFVSTADEHCHTFASGELAQTPLNQEFQREIERFLLSDVLEQSFVVADSAEATLENAHIINIRMTKNPEDNELTVCVMDSIGTILVGNELIRERNQKDACQDAVLRSLIGQANLGFRAQFEHPAVNPQQDANCLIEAVNKQIARDLGLLEQALTPADIRAVRFKLDHALRAKVNFPFDTLVNESGQSEPVYAFYLQCLAVVATAVGGAMIVAGILSLQPAIAATGLALDVAGAVALKLGTHGLFSNKEQVVATELQASTLSCCQ